MFRMVSILAVIALATLSASIFVYAANKINFLIKKSALANDFNYSGFWKSQSIPYISGRILAKLPYPPPLNTSFEIHAFIYYNITSLYCLGQLVSIKLEGFISESGVSSGDNEDNKIFSPPPIVFKLSKSENNLQMIEYVSTSNEHFTRIVGGYRSKEPLDIGIFSLRRIY